jgi:hypothetical protein
MHARYYSPWEHRFLSVDPIGGDPRQPQSWNAFSYVLNNPMNLVDPYGLIECSWDGQTGTLSCTEDAPTISLPLDWFFPEQRFDPPDLPRQPVDDSMQKVLEAGFVDSFRPCAESFGTLYARSWNQTHNAGFSLLSWKPYEKGPRLSLGLTDIFRKPAGWIAGVASSKAFAAPGPLSFALSGFRGATMQGTAFTALETGVISTGVWAGGVVFGTLAYETGVAVGTGINVYLAQPCTKVP